MPFELKNAGAIYQRMVSNVFVRRIRRILEAYIHGTVVKGKHFKDHLRNLKTMFEKLRKYRVTLNPKKCMFPVKLGMLLGHVVEGGIEAMSI